MAPQVFAHRGGAALRPENTMAAFDHARALGAHGIELDVRLSRDRHAVVIHDDSLDRTTDATGPVASLTADELARLDAGFRFRPERDHPWRGRGAGVPRLRSVLERYPDLPIIVELKGSDLALADAVVDDVRAAGATARVCVGGFDQAMLRHVRRCDPAIVTGAAREEVRWALYLSWLGIARRRVGYCAFHVPEHAGRIRVVSRRFVDVAHRAGVRVDVWTVNHEEEARRLGRWGVDSVISDRPDMCLEALAKRPGYDVTTGRMSTGTS